MKKLSVTLMTLLFLPFSMTAMADQGEADLKYNGETFHFTFESLGIVEDELNVFITCEDGTHVTFDTPDIEAYVMIDGERVDPYTFDTEFLEDDRGLYTFIFARDVQPDSVWIRWDETLYPEGEATLLWPSLAQAAAVPVELITGWYGTGTSEENKKDTIDIELKVDADGAGEITLGEGRKSETFPVIFYQDMGTFASDDSADAAGNGEVDGTWALENDLLVLTITRTAANGTSASYTAECDKLANRKLPVDEVLDALDVDLYRTAYKALSDGEVIASGSKGDAAKGVQQTLVALGQSITVDGNIGPRTIEALKNAQKELGLKQTEKLDAEGYAELLSALLNKE